MADLFWAAPAAPPTPPPLDLWTGFQHTWEGWDGSLWNLSSMNQGVALLKDGITGMHLPEFDQQIDEYASVDGGRYRGTRTLVRNPEWLVGVYGDSSDEWRELDVAFWRSLHPDRPGVWRVTDHLGRTRSLRCRLRSSTEHQYGIDPVEAGWSLYTVTLLAEQPYWEGEEVRSPTWTSAAPVDFIDSETLGPPFHPGSATTTGNATLTNTGDIDTSITWTANGPITSLNIEAAGGALAYGSITDGDELVISTDPTRPQALLNGVDVSGDVDPWDPRPIPAGETVALDISMVGGGTLQASFTPRYFRAF